MGYMLPVLFCTISSRADRVARSRMTRVPDSQYAADWDNSGEPPAESTVAAVALFLRQFRTPRFSICNRVRDRYGFMQCRRYAENAGSI